MKNTNYLLIGFVSFLVLVGIFTPAPFEPNAHDLDNIFTPPFSISESGKMHYLGTTELGKDVLGILVHGTNLALQIGFGVALLTGFIGIIVGIISGFYANKYRVSLFNFILFLLVSTPLIIYLLLPIPVLSHWAYLIIFLLVISPLLIPDFFDRKISIPLDTIINKVIQFNDSFPSLVIYLAIFSIIEKVETFHIILVMSLMFWTGVTTIVRSETLALMNKPYIQMAIRNQVPFYKIVYFHLLNKVTTNARVHLVLVAGKAIIAESILSFLRIGDREGIASWGSLIRVGQENIHFWWLILFPTLLLSLTTWSLYRLSFITRTN